MVRTFCILQKCVDVCMHPQYEFVALVLHLRTKFHVNSYTNYLSGSLRPQVCIAVSKRGEALMTVDGGDSWHLWLQCGR
jgi:hypothetical protein